MTENKPWWESKTIWLNVAVGVLAGVEVATDALKPVLPPEALGGVLALVSVINVVLRSVTGKPIARRKTT